MCVFVLSLLKASEDILKKSMLFMGSRVFLGKAFWVLGDHSLSDVRMMGVFSRVMKQFSGSSRSLSFQE